MQSLIEIFRELKITTEKNSESYNIASLPTIKNHKIGISHFGHPMYFIKCEEFEKAILLDSNLQYISVHFNRSCQLLYNNNKIEEGFYTIISLKTDLLDLQEYFLNVVYYVIRKLPPNPNFRELKEEIEKLLNLFSKLSKPAIKTIQGLWAELLIIEQSSNPDYLIQAWHCSSTDRFDFNDGENKVEVKSTSKSKRIHTFSIEQLSPNKNSKLIIASVFAVETGIGSNIFELINIVYEKLNDKNLIFRINEIVAQTLGKDFEKAFDIFYDYQLAVDSIAFYDSVNIPTINSNIISKEINNVRFDCDLTELKNFEKIETDSILHKSLFQK